MAFKFPTQFDKRERQFSEKGSRKMPVYKMKIDKDTGSRSLRKVGEDDIYSKIQSHKDSVDINYILSRYARGDVSALSKIQGTYGDFTEMPTTLAELSQRVIDAENIFYQLPLEKRAQFNHSPSEFFSQFGSEKFNAIFDIKPQKEDFQPTGTEVPAGTGAQPTVQKGEVNE